MNRKAAPLGLYIHIPWCIKKCPYCDFNSHALFDEIPEHDYVQALLRDLDLDLARFPGRRVDSIFFGGGTPSLFSPEAIYKLVDSVKSRIDCHLDMEVTLEANPGTVEGNKFRFFKEAGINRLSIGVQSFQSAQLKVLGRIHTAGEAIRAAEKAHDAGIDNFNLDLMYGLPDQGGKEASADVLQAIALEPAHISYYQLTVEAHTWFSKHPPVLPSENAIWEIQCEGHSLLNDRGYRQYEISAFAKPGYRCRHNLNYWNFGDYLGIGAGAHSKITDTDTGTIHRISKVRHPDRYRQSAGTPAAIENRIAVPTKEIALEFLMNALRLNAGFEKSEFSYRTNLRLSDLEPTLSECLDEGLLQEDPSSIRCTEHGRNFLDSILARFVLGN